MQLNARLMTHEKHRRGQGRTNITAPLLVLFPDLEVHLWPASEALQNKFHHEL